MREERTMVETQRLTRRAMAFVLAGAGAVA